MHVFVCDKSKWGRNPENNKLGAVCAASPNDVRHNRKWIILPVNRERSDISNWATRAERLSCHIGPRGVCCLLTFQDSQTHQPTLAVCVASHFPTSPTLPHFFSLVLPPASRWIFSHPLTLKILLTATARECQSEGNVCALRVMWFLELQGCANQNAFVSQCEQTTKKE